MPGQGWSPEQRVDPPPDDAGVGFVPVIGASVVADGKGTFLVVWPEESPDPASTALD